MAKDCSHQRESKITRKEKAHLVRIDFGSRACLYQQPAIVRFSLKPTVEKSADFNFLLWFQRAASQKVQFAESPLPGLEVLCAQTKIQGDGTSSLPSVRHWFLR